MTFWDDLKAFFWNVGNIVDLFDFGRYINERIAFLRTERDDKSIDKIRAMHDEQLKNYSETLAIVPALLNPPAFNTLYDAGSGKLLNRRVSHTYLADLLGAPDYIEHQRRFNNSEIDYKWYLSELGYDDVNQGILKDLQTFYPAARDFITFGVREVFQPAVVDKYGYDKDFPSDILPFAAKAGLNEDVMKWYWRSHWQLPSFYNIREARWRGLIDDAGVDEFLKVADYPEYWRGMLKGIINTPYTRVDVRRLYDAGVITRDGVKRNYLDIGYDDSHAENLTKFTVINADKTKEVLSTFINGYKQGLITEEELKAKMQGLEYSEDEITLRIQILNTKEVVQPRKRRLTLTNIKKLYQEGFITTDILDTLLIGLNYDEEGVKYMKMLIIAETEPYKAWVSEIKKAYLKGILTRDEATSRFTELGYTLQAINLSLDLIDLKKKESE